MTVLSGNKPISMKDQGFYDDHSQMQRIAIDTTFPYIKESLAQIPLPAENERFTIVDYGCSEGKNSTYVVSKIIDNICARRNNQLFKAIFNDIPANNFNKLFENIGQNLLQKPNLLTFASGQPFHLQVMPEQSIHFGYSSSAAHWLSTVPEFAVRSHIYHGGATAKEQEKLSAIAAKDWSNFLHRRAEEMVSGARLVVTMGSNLTAAEHSNKMIRTAPDTDQFLYNKRRTPKEIYTGETMMNLLNKVLNELVEANMISPQQAENVCSPVYMRNLDELLAPFKEEKLSKVLSVEHADLVNMHCPYFKEYVQNGDHKLYAHSLASMYRAFSETFLWHQLFSIKERRRSSREKLDGQKIIDEFYRRVESYIESDPEYYTFFPIHSILVVAKK